MKKLFIFAIALLLLLSVSSVGIAKTQHGGLLLNRIVIIEDAPIISTLVTIKNLDVNDFNNGKIVVIIPELGLRASHNVNINDGSSKTVRVIIDLPFDVPSGDYYVRIVVSNENHKRVKHRLITI